MTSSRTFTARSSPSHFTWTTSSNSSLSSKSACNCSPPEGKMARPLRVLIADDDRDLADAIAGYVRECGHEPVATISAGGLEVIRRYGQYEPDVVLLDIM